MIFPVYDLKLFLQEFYKFIYFTRILTSSRMKKILVCLLMLLMALANANAQQQFQVSQYMFSQMSFNPAYAGSQDMIELDGLNRHQWSGFPGAPVTSVFNVNASVKPFRTQGGVGITLVNDKIGINNQLSLAGTYAYRFNIGNGKLAIGARLGFINFNAKFSELTPNNNLSLPTDERSMAFPDVDLGVYYNTDKTFFGVSSVHITNPHLKFQSTNDPLNFISRAYVTSAGYRYQFSNPLFELQPSVFVMTDFTVTYADLTGILFYNRRLWGGVTYRTGNSLFGNAIVILVGLELKNGLKFGYSYDISTSALGKYNTGSHEITLRYGFRINNEKIPQKYKSIRFL